MKRELKKEGFLKRRFRGLFNRKLLKNKIYSIILLILGHLLFSVEGTIAIFIILLGIALFFSKENYIV